MPVSPERAADLAWAASVVAAERKTVRVTDEPFGEDIGPFETGRVLVALEHAGVVSPADQKGRRRVLISDPGDAARAVTTWCLEQR